MKNNNNNNESAKEATENKSIRYFGFMPPKDLEGYLDSTVEYLALKSPYNSFINLNLFKNGDSYSAHLAVNSTDKKFISVATKKSIVDLVEAIFVNMHDQIKKWKAIRFFEIVQPTQRSS